MDLKSLKFYKFLVICLTKFKKQSNFTQISSDKQAIYWVKDPHWQQKSLLPQTTSDFITSCLGCYACCETSIPCPTCLSKFSCDEDIFFDADATWRKFRELPPILPLKPGRPVNVGLKNRQRSYPCRKVRLGQVWDYYREKYHCTVDLLFDWFGIVCFTNKNKTCQLSYS